jgi:hypothetical protein
VGCFRRRRLRRDSGRAVASAENSKFDVHPAARPGSGRQSKKCASNVPRKAASAQRENIAMKAVVQFVTRQARDDSKSGHRSLRGEKAPAEKTYGAVDAATQTRERIGEARRGRARRGGSGDSGPREMTRVVKYERDVRASGTECG